MAMSGVGGSVGYTGGAGEIGKKAAAPVAMPFGGAANKPGFEVPSSGMQSRGGSAEAVPVKYGTMETEGLTSGPAEYDQLNDPSAWTDETEAFESEYGTQAEAQESEEEDIGADYWGNTGGTAQDAWHESGGKITPDQWQDYADDYGKMFTSMTGKEQADFITGTVEGEAIFGPYKDKYGDAQDNPGPGFRWDRDAGVWVQDKMPVGISADDPGWDYDEFEGRWAYTPGTKSKESGEEVDKAFGSSPLDYAIPQELIDKQKKEAWDKAGLANQEMASMLGSRGIGASGLAGLGLGNVMTATQDQVQQMDFDNYALGIESRLSEVNALLARYSLEMTEEGRQNLAKEANDLTRDLEEARMRGDDEGDAWQAADNFAASYKEEAPQGWGVGQLEEFLAFVRAGGNPEDARLSVAGEHLQFDGGTMPKSGGGSVSGSSHSHGGWNNESGWKAPGWKEGDPLAAPRSDDVGSHGFLGQTATYEDYVAREAAMGYQPHDEASWKKWGWTGRTEPDSEYGREEEWQDAQDAYFEALDAANASDDDSSPDLY